MKEKPRVGEKRKQGLTPKSAPFNLDEMKRGAALDGPWVSIVQILNTATDPLEICNQTVA